MAAQVTSMFEPTDGARILELEQKLRAALPADYRAFLLAYNGGRPKPNVFFISAKEQESTLSVLFGITERKAYDLWSNALNAWDDIDRSYLPIGEDPGGNQLYVSLAPDKRGQIFFRDHEAPMPDALTPIAASFTEFLDGLHELL